MTPVLSTAAPGPPGNDSANNATRLLTALHRRGGAATRAELTADLDCGRSAAGYALADLVERGLVTVDEHPQHPSQHPANAASAATACLLYKSDAAADGESVDPGGDGQLKKKK
ncbi:helix-turn-helix transcriptional regulator, partial [Actinocrinis puniceicyclus]